MKSPVLFCELMIIDEGLDAFVETLVILLPAFIANFTGINDLHLANCLCLGDTYV